MVGRWGGRHPCARAKPLKGDPVMRLLGQEPLRRGRATGGWQDSCAVHDLGASDGESAPWRQDARAAYSPTALCGAFWMHGAHILPKLAVFEYMQAICCHEPVFFPSEAPSGTHRGDILPWPCAGFEYGIAYNIRIPLANMHFHGASVIGRRQNQAHIAHARKAHLHGARDRGCRKRENSGCCP